MGGTFGLKRGVILPKKGLQVVESAADALGARSAPLVCVEGVPSTAAVVLLRRLAAAEARVAFTRTSTGPVSASPSR